MRSLVFQVQSVHFVVLLLFLAAQAAVDVFILDKRDYPDNSFTLEHLECRYDGYPNIKGEPFVAVQASITLGENSAKITWPNNDVVSKQDAAPVQELEKRPEYQNAFYALATNPNIDGRRSFIIPTNATAIEGKDIEITFGLESLTKEEKEMLNEINKLQTSQTNSDTAQAAPLPKVGAEIDRGACGQVYYVAYEDGPLVGKDLVMKTCKANQPGTVVLLEQWAVIDFLERINRNDYRIGQLLNTVNQENSKIGAKYYTEGRIEINGIHCYYFTMEKIIGKSIEDDLMEALAAKSRGDPSKLAQIFMAMLKAIIQLHKVGVLHRDLHHGNFMKLEGSDEYVTIDYGLSRVAVEWENHIKQNRPILTESSAMYQPLRGDFNLGTDFHDDVDMFVFHTLSNYINKKFFGDPNARKSVLIGNKMELLAGNWLEWPHLKQTWLKYVTDSLAENLNDMLFLSPTLLHCRDIHDQKLGQDKVKLSLKATDEKLFARNANAVIEYEFSAAGCLKQKVLPVVEDRYKWPEYDEYKTALSNIEGKKGGKRHPRENSTA